MSPREKKVFKGISEVGHASDFNAGGSIVKVDPCSLRDDEENEIVQEILGVRISEADRGEKYRNDQISKGLDVPDRIILQPKSDFKKRPVGSLDDNFVTGPTFDTQDHKKEIQELLEGNSLSEHTSVDSQKQLGGKLKYYGRVDIDSCVDGIARLRKVAIEDIKKYPESMEWPDISEEEFLDAIFRHTKKMMKHGVDALDPETGLPHLYAIQFNAMVIEMKRKNRER